MKDLLIKFLLPWVVQLLAAAIDRYLRPFVTEEGFNAIRDLFQKFYNESVEKGRTNVQAFVAGVLAPVFKVEIALATPAPTILTPEEINVDALKMVADLAVELNDNGELKFPYHDEFKGDTILPGEQG